MIPTNINPTAKAELAKLTFPTDTVKEVEPTTDKHYDLNFRFEITRDNKKYFMSVKEVNVIGEEKKFHVRLEVDTDLPKEIIKADNSDKIFKLELKLTKTIKKMKMFEVYNNFHNLTEWITASKEVEKIQNSIIKLS